MDALYTLRSDVTTDNYDNDTISYGINIHKLSGEIMEVVPYIFDDKQKAKTFIMLCNTEKLDTVHLHNVIDDFCYE